MDSYKALEAYLDFLETSNSSNPDKENHSTPHIDTVLQMHRQRTGKGVESDGSQWSHPQKKDSYEYRLIQLEEKLTDLLTRSKENKPERGVYCNSTSTKEHRSTDTDNTSPSSPQLTKKPNLPLRKTGPLPLSDRRRIIRKKIPAKRAAAPKVTSMLEDKRKKDELLKEKSAPSLEDNGGSSVQALTLQLETEHQRRWKSEQAASRLVEHVRVLQSRVSETEKTREAAVIKGFKLEKELAEEKGTGQILQKRIQQLEENTSSYQWEQEELQSRHKEQIKLLRQLEDNYNNLEMDRLKEVTHLHSCIREREDVALGHQRELELVKKSLKENKNQIRQLQELLAKREGEYQKEKEKCQPLDSKAVQELVARQVEEQRLKVEATTSQLKLRLCEHAKAYQSLEDEFRMGLKIEASRYNELEKSYRDVCNDVQATRQTAMTAVQKEKRAEAMLSELTDMVKEQKGKIGELTRNKQEVVAELKERVSFLEKEMADKNKLEARMISLQEEKGKLQSQVTAQVSVIDGLREERQLWGKELAHQGASLAQERGRMEAQLESLSEETKSLRQEIQKTRDSLRVKEKQVEDQVHSLFQLKQKLAGKEDELHTMQNRNERDKEDVKLKLELEESDNAHLQDQLDALFERKEQLKEEVLGIQEEKKQWKSKFDKLNSQWEEKVKIIDTLELNLQQLQKSFSEKESQLLLEKDQAVAYARDHEERLKKCDDRFREQLEAKERVFHANLSRVAAEKNKELNLANQKVESVEEEMRELLHEVAKERKNMEVKLHKLSSVMQDLQHDIPHNN